MADYDIAIVGLGPAGATLARLLSENYRVVAIDRKSQNQEGLAQKCCGGLLADDAQKALARFGLALPKEVLVDSQIFAVRTIDLAITQERYYQRFYLNMDRHRFDQWLVSLIPGHVEILEKSLCQSVKWEGEAFRLEVKQQSGKRSLTAKIVIGADGANSIVRRELYPASKIKQYISIQEWYKAPQRDPFYAAIFDESLTDSYAWALSKDDHLLLGGAFPRDNAKARFDQLREKLKARGTLVFGQRVKREGCFVSSPRFPGQFCPGGEAAFLVGEAAGYISASSLEGISYAIDSGDALAKACNGGLEAIDKRYRRNIRPLEWKLRGKTIKAPFLANPQIRRFLLETGLQSIVMDGNGLNRPQNHLPD